MNIFYLSDCPEQSAKDHCDKHVVKMILETAQLLSTAHRVLDGDEFADTGGLYKTVHKNHPSAKWVRASGPNYKWALNLFRYLNKEYVRRYKKTHKSFMLMQMLAVLPRNIPLARFVEPPQCMPDHYKHDNTITAYRNYYKGDKRRFAKWSYSDKPSWWTELSYDY